MVTAEELAVKIKSEGVNETKSDLQGVEESMSDTAESAGSSAEQLQGFSERFAGAMTAAVGALALGAAGLLSQVPVLGEAFSGLSAIVDAVALKMDSVLRPAISGVTNTLFEIANAIFEADGGMGKLIGRLGVVASLAGLVAGALAAVGVTLTGPILLAIAGAAAAVAALWTAWETNFANIRGVVESTVNAIRSRLQKFVSVVAPIVQGFLNRLEKIWDNNGDAIISAVNFALRVVGTAFEQAFDAILTVVQAGLQLLSGDFDGALQTITGYIERTISRWKPLFEDVINTLFDIANGIMNLEGTAADLAGVLGVVLTAVTGAAAGLAAWAIKAKGVIGAASALGGALKTIGSVLVGVVGGISATTAALAGAVAAIAAFAVAYLTNFKGVRDTTNRIVGNIVSTVVGGVTSFVNIALSKLRSFAGGVRDALGGVADTVREWAGDLADKAFDFGRGLIQDFINGIKSLIGRVGSLLAPIRDISLSISPPSFDSAVNAVSRFVTTFRSILRGVRDTAGQIWGQIKSTIAGAAKSFVSSVLSKIGTFVSDVNDFFTTLASDLSGWASGVASDAKEWGKDIIRGMIDGVTSLAESVAKAVETVINGMIRVINIALDQLPDQVTSRLGVESFSMVDFDTSFGGGGTAGGTPGGRGRPIARTANGQGVSLDGRTLTESTGRYRSDPGRRRGL